MGPAAESVTKTGLESRACQENLLQILSVKSTLLHDVPINVKSHPQKG
jgi:hypothetical protein